VTKYLYAYALTWQRWTQEWRMHSEEWLIRAMTIWL
jgi:hypothetical protein